MSKVAQAMQFLQHSAARMACGSSGELKREDVRALMEKGMLKTVRERVKSWFESGLDIMKTVVRQDGSALSAKIVSGVRLVRCQDGARLGGRRDCLTISCNIFLSRRGNPVPF